MSKIKNFFIIALGAVSGDGLGFLIELFSHHSSPLTSTRTYEKLHADPSMPLVIPEMFVHRSNNLGLWFIVICAILGALSAVVYIFASVIEFGPIESNVAIGFAFFFLGAFLTVIGYSVVYHQTSQGNSVTVLEEENARASFEWAEERYGVDFPQPNKATRPLWKFDSVVDSEGNSYSVEETQKGIILKKD